MSPRTGQGTRTRKRNANGTGATRNDNPSVVHYSLVTKSS